MRFSRIHYLFAVLAVVAMAASAEARIRGIVIEQREASAYKGQSF